MIYRIYIALILIIGLAIQPAYAYWVWTPESGKWENPKYAAKDTPEEQLTYSQDAYKQGNFKLALKEFKKLIKYYPLSKEAPTAQYYIGRIMQDTGKYYDAFKALQKVIDLYPYTELVDDVIEREYRIGELFFEHKTFTLSLILIYIKMVIRGFWDCWPSFGKSTSFIYIIVKVTLFYGTNRVT